MNLRGAECDEREPKWQSKVSQKARSDITDNIEDITMQNTAVVHGFDSTPIASCSATSNSSNTSESEQVITRLRYDLNLALVRIEELEGKVFKYENLSSEDILNYNSLNKDALEVLLCLLNCFKPFNYWYGFEVKSVNSKNQLLISLMKLKMDIPFFDLVTRFRVSRTTVTNIFLTYLHLMHETLFKGAMQIIPSLTKKKASMPESCGDFSNCRIIIDCTEFRLSTPRRDLEAANLSYSNYKHNLTGKVLIGVAPNGAITFVSEEYPGSTIDKVVTQESEVLGPLEVSISYLVISIKKETITCITCKTIQIKFIWIMQQSLRSTLKLPVAFINRDLYFDQGMSNTNISTVIGFLS